MNYIYLLVLSILLLLVLSYHTFERDIFSPTVMTLLVFLISSLHVVYCVDFWQSSIDFPTYCILLIGFLTCYFSEYLCKKIFGVSRDDNVKYLVRNELHIKQTTLIFFLIIGIILGFMYIIEIMNVNGWSLLSIGAYKLEGDLSIIAKIALQYNNFMGIICGYVLIYSIFTSKKSTAFNKLLIFYVMFVFIVLFFSGTRTYILRYIMALAFMVWIFGNENNFWKKKTRSKKKLYIYLICIGIAFILFFYIVRTVVKNRANDETQFMVYLSYYVGSPIHLFAKVIENNNVPIPQYFGEYSLAALYDSLKRIGVWRLNVIDKLPMTPVGGSLEASGNAYTFFYRFYCDFGIWGVIIGTFVVYGLISGIYYRYFKNRYNFTRYSMRLMILSYFYYIIVMSFYEMYLCLELKLMNLLYILFMVMIWKVINKFKIMIY